MDLLFHAARLRNDSPSHLVLVLLEQFLFGPENVARLFY